ncbi:hypothetical protein RJT34_32254 [Clitoria ternatea]|uniref:Ubiquitin-like protease family profile domain-containing protein n=1 Tax=Clitoria ternatea TaxID=43366 RepID=A0AAN9EZY0_CLITE
MHNIILCLIAAMLTGSWTLLSMFMWIEDLLVRGPMTSLQHIRDDLKALYMRIHTNVDRVTDVVKDKTGKDLDVSSWEREFVEDLPKQQNGYDCGVFMIKYADFHSRNLRLCFNQEHMPYFRLRTAKEILRLKAD